jgi:hypothetical protein
MPDFFAVIPQPDISLWGTTINEPVTAATGLFISVAALIAYRKLDRTSNEQWPARLMAYFFIFLGLSNFFGAIAGHAFYQRLDLWWKVPGWSLGMVAVGMVAQASIIRWNGNGPVKKAAIALSVLNAALFAGLLYSAIAGLNFKMVEMYSAFSLVGIMLPIEISLYRSANSQSSIWMLKALIPAFIAVLLHILKFSFSPWFNFFDIGHILLCGTVLYFFRSARIMKGERNIEH